MVHNNSMANCRRAVMERVYAVELNGKLARPPSPAAGVFNRLDYFSLAVVRACGWTPRMSHAEFAACYSGARLKRYVDAAASLCNRALKKKDSYLSSFVKAEGVKLSPDKPDPAPRIIQPRSPRYNVCVGSFLKPLEHKIYSAIASVWGGHPVVMKGYNARRVATLLKEKWDRYRDPVAVGLDASRFDQHVSMPALMWEHEVYLRCYPQHRKELGELLKWQLRGTGFVRTDQGDFKYKVNGCRMSGDMNTALGNCLLMCAMIHRFAKERHLACDLANNGDDCVLVLERSQLHKIKGLKEWFSQYGFTMKQETPVSVFEQVEFCQTKPVYNGEHYIMTRLPMKALCKDVMLKGCGDDLSPKQYRKWLGDVGTCGGALSPGMPIFQSFYAGLRRHAGGESCCARGGLVDSGFARMVTGLTSETRPVTPEARLSFWLAFGVLPEAQVALENHFETLRLDLSRSVDYTTIGIPNLVERLTQ